MSQPGHDNPPGPSESSSRKGQDSPASEARKTASSNANRTTVTSRTLGKFRVLHRIGKGGMGTVFRAIQEDLKREVALKVLPSSKAANPRLVERFQREARAAARLDHPNIIKLYDVHHTDGRHYISMEFVDGVDLADIISNQKLLEIPTALDYLKQAAQALDHAYQKSLVHRDIKPANFLIAHDGTVKLCDFGLALSDEDDDESRMTQHGSTVGTVDYMAPEQGRNSRLADSRSDMYALGCTFYHMLTGSPPFDTGSVAEKLYKHNTIEPPDPLGYNPAIPGEVLFILNKMMEKEPGKRYQTPQALMLDIDTLDLDSGFGNNESTVRTLEFGLDDTDEDLEQTAPVLSRSRSKPSVDLQSLKKPLWIGVISVATVIVLSILIVLMWPSDPDPNLVQNTRDPGAVEPETNQAEIALPPTVHHVESGKATNDPGTGGPGMQNVAQGAGADTTNQSNDPDPVPVQPGTEGTQSDPLPTKAQIDQIHKDFYIAWPEVQVPSGKVVVARGAAGGEVYGSIEAACRRAQTNSAGRQDIGNVVIEDNGPLFERSFQVKKAKLSIRPTESRTREARTGTYRPVIAFDPKQSNNNSTPYLIQSIDSQLELEGLDIVVNADDIAEVYGIKPVSIFDVTNGELSLINCTVTVIGNCSAPISLATLDSGRVQLARCEVRGLPLELVRVASQDCEIQISESLIVTGSSSLMSFLSPPGSTSSELRQLRVTRSTFVSAGDFISIDNTRSVAFDFRALDCVIATSGGDRNRKLIAISSPQSGADSPPSIELKARGLMMAGWEELLSFRHGVETNLLAATTTELENLVQYDGRNVMASSDVWPANEFSELLTTDRLEFDTEAISAQVPSSLGEDRIGCPLNELPEITTLVAQRTFQLFDPPPLSPWIRHLPSLLSQQRYNPLIGRWRTEQNKRARAQQVGGNSEPETDIPPDDVVELNFDQSKPGADLGKFLMGQELSATTFVRITGAGRFRCSPIHLNGKSIVLLFEHSRSRDQEPLTLVPNPESQLPYMIRISSGDLVIEGVDFAVEGNGSLQRFLDVRGGNLTVVNSRLIGPLSGAGIFRETVRFQGGPQQAIAYPEFGNRTAQQLADHEVHFDFHPAPHASVNVCQFANCYLASAPRVLNLNMEQAVVRLENNVIAAPSTMAMMTEMAIDPDQAYAAVVLSRNTFVVAGTYFEVGSWLNRVLPKNPMLFHSTDNLYSDPVDSGSKRSLILEYSGRTLQQGLIQWQSIHDGYSRDIHSFVNPKDAGLSARQRFEENWQSIWGRSHMVSCLVEPAQGGKVRMVGKRFRWRDLHRSSDPSGFMLQANCDAAKAGSNEQPLGAILKRVD